MFSELFDKNGNPAARKLAANPEAVQQLRRLTSWLPETAQPAERLWCLSRGYTSYPKHCGICSSPITAFRSWSEGYAATTCSRSCARKESAQRRPRHEKLQPPLRSPEERLARFKETSRARYGTDFPWQAPEIKEQRRSARLKTTAALWIEQLTERAALLPLFTADDYAGNRAQLPVRCTACSTEFCISRFSNESPSTSALRCPSCYTHNASLPQIEIAEYCRSLGATPRYNDRRVIFPFEIDIWMPEQNLGIEYDGLYYHSERCRPDIKTALTKKIAAIKHVPGLKVIFIGESDWIRNPDIVKSRLSSALGHNTRIQARRTAVREIDSATAATFFKQTHIQGSVPASVYLGLYSGTELVAAASFCRPRFGVADFELLRYSSRLFTNVIGGAGKLIAAFRAQHPSASILSYSDDKWGSGQLYEKLGFQNTGSTGLSYFYVSTRGEIVSRFAAQKSRLSRLLDSYDASKTERENMEAAGYSRVWEPGNTRWLLKPR